VPQNPCANVIGATRHIRIVEHVVEERRQERKRPREPNQARVCRGKLGDTRVPRNRDCGMLIACL
jgi:hypothetical protein